MKRVYAFLALLMSSLLLFAACDQEKQEEKPAMLGVKIEAADRIELNKETTIACVVTYGGEKVDDADEVKFEIWKHGNEQHDMLKAKNEGNGKYSVKKTFTEPGTYSVVAHVTARNMHNMPKKDIVVGQASEQHHEHNDHHHNAGHSGHHHTDLSIMLQHKEYVVNQSANLTARIAHAGKPLTNATVRFEVWKDDGKHQFIDASETQAGQYEAATTFQEKGAYSVKIHVEAKEIHEHQIEQITVK